MPTFTENRANLAASTKTANILSGQVVEFVEVDSIVSVYHVSSAGGVNTSVFADSDLVVDDREIVFIGTTLLEDHLVDSFPVAAGTRLAIFLRETAAAATTDVLSKVKIDPL